MPSDAQRRANKAQDGKRKRKPLWLSKADAERMDSLKRQLGVKTRPDVLRKLFDAIPLPKKKAPRK